MLRPLLAALPLLLLTPACRSPAAPPPAPPRAPAPAPDAQPTPEQACRETACRPPQTVTLLLDEEREMRQELPPFPYTYRDVIYLVPGDDFRVTGDLQKEGDGERLVHLRVVAEGEAPPHALHLRFAQEVESRSSFMMLLSVESTLPRTLRYDLSMLPASGGGWERSSSCPVPPGRSVFESWPQPLRTVVLDNLRLGAAPGGAPAADAGEQRCE